jgi:hypothetical protein
MLVAWGILISWTIGLVFFELEFRIPVWFARRLRWIIVKISHNLRIFPLIIEFLINISLQSKNMYQSEWTQSNSKRHFINIPWFALNFSLKIVSLNEDLTGNGDLVLKNDMQWKTRKLFITNSRVWGKNREFHGTLMRADLNLRAKGPKN